MMEPSRPVETRELRWKKLYGSDFKRESSAWLELQGLGILRVHSLNETSSLILSEDGKLFRHQLNTENGSYSLQPILESCFPSSRFRDVCMYNGQETDPNIQIIVVLLDSGEAYQVDIGNEKIISAFTNATHPEALGTTSLLNSYTTYKSCSSGKDHLILLDTDGKVWSTGKGPQTGHIHEIRDSPKIKSKGPCESIPSDLNQIPVSSIEFFQGVKILSSDSGKDFNVVIVERVREDIINEEVPENITIGPGSCPLGLPIKEHRSNPDLPKDEEDVVLRRNAVKTMNSEIDNSCTEDSKLSDEVDKSPRERPFTHVERLAQSGLYLNPSDAIKFLSDQLSWIGKGVGSIVDENECQKPSQSGENADVTEIKTNSIISQNETTTKEKITESEVSKPSLATSLVSEGMKVVGNTVSKLSRSLTLGSEIEKNEEDFLLSNEKDLVDESPTESPPSPLPKITLKVHRKNETLKRSPTYIPTNQPGRKLSGPFQRSQSMTHRRSQSATSLSKANVSEFLRSKKGARDFGKLDHSPLDREVWFWGKGRRGQCGQGDMLDRLQPSAIPSLSNLGVQKVSCGESHCLALTLSGLVYGWGDNTYGQACPYVGLAVCPLPQPIILAVNETAIDICADGNISFIATDKGNIYKMGAVFNEHSSKGMKKLSSKDLELETNEFATKILACSNYLLGSPSSVFMPLITYKSIEKNFLKKMCEIEKKVLEPLFGKCHDNGKDEFGKSKVKVLETSRKVIEVVARSVSHSWQNFSIESLCQIPVLHSANELGESLELYTKAVCDCLVVNCLSLDGSNVLSKATLTDLLENLCQMKSTEESKALLRLLLLEPTSQLVTFIDSIKDIINEARLLKIGNLLRTCTNLEASIHVLRQHQREIEKAKQLTHFTAEFWEMAGPKMTGLMLPSRRIFLDSRITPIGVANAASFSKNWIILMNDILVHAGYSTYSVHPLETVWIDASQSSRSISENSSNENVAKFEITLVMPEDTLTLSASTPEAKSEWLSCLQRAILHVLGSPLKPQSVTPPITRTTSYIFKKIPELKGAKYTGSWMQGKLHGHGSLEWSDGRTYVGQLRQNQRHGIGRMEVVDSSGGITIFEGQWKLDKFDGNGTVTYSSKDVYMGSIHNGKPHGQGTLKQGKFMGSGASVYIGEWNNGLRHGYGVLDDIVSGEKYMGMWSNDMKSGPGCVVTVDGVYYEGTFSHGKMTGKGLMMFEDETVYEGSFADAGVFSGHGLLTYANGDRLEGSFYGNYSDGMKFNGTVYKTVKSPVSLPVHIETPFGQDKIGTYSVHSSKKWSSVFTLFEDMLGLPDHRSSQIDCRTSPQEFWEHLAIQINQNKNAACQQTSQSLHFHGDTIQSSFTTQKFGVDVLDGLEMIPNYHENELNQQHFKELSHYLSKAFQSPLHPLSNILSTLSDCFTSTYGGVRVHPRLLKHARDELQMMVNGLYHLVHCLFPALPLPGKSAWLQDESNPEKGEIVCSTTIIYPYLLPRIYVSIYMLYTLHCKREDDEYWTRIMKWNRHPDIALLSFLGVDEKFWLLDTETSRRSVSQIRDRHFSQAIETLQQLKTNFTPFEKLNVLLETFKEINRTGQAICGAEYSWSMDELFPVFSFIVVRARILQLGAEIHMIKDLTQEASFINGEFDIMFTTLQASYYQILRESISMY